MSQPPDGRWFQLAVGIVCMILIANLQYGWTLFVQPIDAAHHWGKPAIQWAFTLFVLAETWLVPLEGWVIDRVGPRAAVLAGGLLIGLCWVLEAEADSLAVLYTGAVIGGVGAGAIYGASIGNAIKWFPDRRGLASGLTAAGFGAGSALTVAPVAAMIASAGYQTTFLVFGIVQGLGVMVAAWFLRAPPRPAVVAAAADGGPELGPAQVVRTRAFWLMYATFVLVAAGGLMATAQLALIAQDFGVAQTPVALLGFTMPALTLALSLDRVLNGLTRPFFGFVSDLIGREITMLIAFGLEGAGILALVLLAKDPVLFVVLSGLVFFGWGEIYSLFPALSGDLFGRRNATANYGLLYTAKGTAALLVPLGSLMRELTGDWSTVLYLAAAMNFAAAFLAIGPLHRLRRGRHTGDAEAAILTAE